MKSENSQLSPKGREREVMLLMLSDALDGGQPLH